MFLTFETFEDDKPIYLNPAAVVAVAISKKSDRTHIILSNGSTVEVRGDPAAVLNRIDPVPKSGAKDVHTFPRTLPGFYREPFKADLIGGGIIHMYVTGISAVERVPDKPLISVLVTDSGGRYTIVMPFEKAKRTIEDLRGDAPDKPFGSKPIYCGVDWAAEPDSMLKHVSGRQCNCIVCFGRRPREVENEKAHAEIVGFLNILEEQICVPGVTVTGTNRAWLRSHMERIYRLLKPVPPPPRRDD